MASSAIIPLFKYEKINSYLHRAHVEAMPCVRPFKGDTLDQLKLVLGANFFTNDH
jgi:hypothetical protein